MLVVHNILIPHTFLSQLAKKLNSIVLIYMIMNLSLVLALASNFAVSQIRLNCSWRSDSHFTLLRFSMANQYWILHPLLWCTTSLFSLKCICHGIWSQFLIVVLIQNCATVFLRLLLAISVLLGIVRKSINRFDYYFFKWHPVARLA